MRRTRNHARWLAAALCTALVGPAAGQLLGSAEPFRFEAELEVQFLESDEVDISALEFDATLLSHSVSDRGAPHNEVLWAAHQPSVTLRLFSAEFEYASFVDDGDEVGLSVSGRMPSFDGAGLVDVTVGLSAYDEPNVTIDSLTLEGGVAMITGEQSELGIKLGLLLWDAKFGPFDEEGVDVRLTAHGKTVQGVGEGYVTFQAEITHYLLDNLIDTSESLTRVSAGADLYFLPHVGVGAGVTLGFGDPAVSLPLYKGETGTALPELHEGLGFDFRVNLFLSRNVGLRGRVSFFQDDEMPPVDSTSYTIALVARF